MLNEAAQKLIADFPLGFVATVAADGAPAVSPKGTFLALDESRIAFGDIRSPSTIANLSRDNRVEVNFIDPFRRKGVRVAGRATIHENRTETFEALHPQWVATWGALAARIRAIVVIDVSRALPLTTPPYDDGVTEEDMIALYKAKFAEMFP